MDGLRLALSWLSVLPVPVGTVDARSSRQAIAFAPLVGAIIGAAGAALLWFLTWAGAPALLTALLAVTFFVLVTRGMHVDGLADTVDGLGCYGPAERALGVMRDGSTGPFAVVALILVLAVQAVSLGALVTGGNFVAVVFACVVGRAAFVLCCHRSLSAARPDGMGALVAGSQSTVVVVTWWLVLLVAGGFAVWNSWWLGVVAVVLTATTLIALMRHVRHRLGGVTGDVLGAAAELSTTIVLAACAFGG